VEVQKAAPNAKVLNRDDIGALDAVVALDLSGMVQQLSLPYFGYVKAVGHTTQNKEPRHQHRRKVRVQDDRDDDGHLVNLPSVNEVAIFFGVDHASSLPFICR
jgi:hypothetical protein